VSSATTATKQFQKPISHLQKMYKARKMPLPLITKQTVIAECQQP
jgi:hypothetical protein